MAIFPKIQRPCPYKGRLSEVMDGDLCRMCNRQVFNLDAMDDQGRVAFLKGCAEEVCVSYTLPLRPMLAAAAITLATLAAPAMAAAQDVPEEIIVGGIKHPGDVQFIEDTADHSIPVLPIVYEVNEPARPAISATTQTSTPTDRKVADGGDPAPTPLSRQPAP